MSLFGSKSPPAGNQQSGAKGQAPSSASRVSGAAAGGSAVGIDHVITLMRSLPTDKHADIVVAVLKATLESLDIRISDIVGDAAQRLKQIDERVAVLKSEIATFEQEIAKRSEEISRMQSAHAETTKVKDYLETEEAQVVSSRTPEK
jgi:hypothetical protein